MGLFFIVYVRKPKNAAETHAENGNFWKNNIDSQDIEKYQKVILGLLDLNCSLLSVGRPSDCHACKNLPSNQRTTLLPCLAPTCTAFMRLFV